jgi:UDP-N-acetylglucosamine:LPS N-acetylglucosamine transferase
MRILLACSAGGHLRQLDALRPWWSEHERHWMTFDKPDAISILEGEAVTWAYHPTARNIPNLIRNFGRTWRVLRRFRPDVIVSTGSAIAVPLFVWSRFFGIRTVFIEVYDRIDNATLSARMVRPITDLFLVQWPEQQHLYPGSVVVGRLM